MTQHDILRFKYSYKKGIGLISIDIITDIVILPRPWHVSTISPLDHNTMLGGIP